MSICPSLSTGSVWTLSTSDCQNGQYHSRAGSDLYLWKYPDRYLSPEEKLKVLCCKDEDPCESMTCPDSTNDCQGLASCKNGTCGFPQLFLVASLCVTKRKVFAQAKKHVHVLLLCASRSNAMRLMNVMALENNVLGEFVMIQSNQMEQLAMVTELSIVGRMQ